MKETCQGSPCGGDKKCDFCHGITQLMAKHDEESDARVTKYEELLHRTEEAAASTIARTEQRVDKLMEVLNKMEDCMIRMEKLHEEIKRDEDAYVAKLCSNNDVLMQQNTTLTNLMSAICTPSANHHHGTNVNINK